MNAETKPRIGFIGLGLMGHGMAKNLVTKGYPLTVRVHRNRKPLEDLVAAGAKEVATDADVARASDIVFLCVTGTPQVETIVYGTNGLLSAAREGLDRRRHVDGGARVDGVDPDGFRREARAVRRRAARAHARRSGAGTAQHDGRRRRRGVRATETRALGVLRERHSCRSARAWPHAEAHQQLHRAGDRHGDGRGVRRRREVRALAQEAARGDLRGRGQLGHLPDDRGQDARGQRRS